MRVTLKAVNAALARADFAGVELVRGNGHGYWYFTGADTALWYSTGVYVYHLNELTVTEWVEEARAKRGYWREQYEDRG